MSRVCLKILRAAAAGPKVAEFRLSRQRTPAAPASCRLVYMKFFDISVPISSELPIYEGDPPTQIDLWEEMARGAQADVRSLRMGTHTGTHVDAPSHFLAGAPSVDMLDLDACIGPAQVLDLTGLAGERIDRADLKRGLFAGVTRLLLKTRNSELWQLRRFEPRFAALTEAAAELLVERGVRLVGIDYLSIGPSDDPGPVHRILLAAGVVILEGLDLSAVAAGPYTLACLPLRLLGAEGAPARAILMA